MYDKKYFKKHETGSYDSAIIILKYIQSFFQFTSIIDYGCGIGTWCKAANDLGVDDILGIDQHIYENDYMLISEKNYKQFDLRTPFEQEQEFDMAISVEVAEHIDIEYSKIFVDNICHHNKTIIFSAALPGQGGRGHINEQPCSYWINLFRQNNYEVIDCIRPYCWDNENVEVWYKNNCMLFIEKNLYQDLVVQVPKHFFPTDIIHPQMLTRILKKKGVING